jgi:hypothetical protein
MVIGALFDRSGIAKHHDAHQVDFKLLPPHSLGMKRPLKRSLPTNFLFLADQLAMTCT